MTHTLGWKLAMFSILVLVLAFPVFASGLTAENRTNFTFTRSGPFNEADLQNVGRSLGVDVVSVEVNDVLVETGDSISLDTQRNDQLSVRIELAANEANADVEVGAPIRGDDTFQIADVSDVFRVEPNTRYVKTLKLKLPDVMQEGTYYLRVGLFDRNSAGKMFNYFLTVEPQRHKIIIRDVTFTPENEVDAGRALLAVVRVRNLGQQDEDNVRVRIAIPGLGVSATDYLDKLRADDSVSSQEMYLRIPIDAKPGVYPVIATAEYKEGFEQDTQQFQIKVNGGMPQALPGPGMTSNGQQQPPAPKEQTVVNVGPQSQDAARGEGGVVFPITLQNQGSTTKSYTIAVTGAEEFSTVKISPSNLVMLDGSETKAVYVFLGARETASTGPHIFTVEIRAGDQVLEQIPLTLNIVEPEGKKMAMTQSNLVTVLIIVLIVLIVAGIALGVAYSKKKSQGKPDAASAQTYY